MTLYMVFVGAYYYPEKAGGDFVATYHDLESAKRIAAKRFAEMAGGWEEGYWAAVVRVPMPDEDRGLERVWTKGLSPL